MIFMLYEDPNLEEIIGGTHDVCKQDDKDYSKLINDIKCCTMFNGFKPCCEHLGNSNYCVKEIILGTHRDIIKVYPKCYKRLYPPKTPNVIP